jgi:hypothetical protein
MAPDDPADHDTKRTRPLRAITAPSLPGARTALLEQLRDLRDSHDAVVAAVEATMVPLHGADLDRWSDDELRDLVARVRERIAARPA